MNTRPDHDRRVAMLLLLAVAWLLPAGRSAADDGQPYFETHVRPILKAHCFQCHGEGEELAGGLDLRLRRLIVAGGDSGAAIEPGDGAASLLHQRVAAGEMPPAEVDQRLSEREKQLITEWIDRGAATRRTEPEQLPPGTFLITEEERSHWSFQPVTRPPLPTIRDATRVRSPIDRFVLSRLEAAQLSFSDDADRAQLVRRLYLDLLGLPPSPEQLQRFVSDSRPDAYERLVDQLLSSPHYGERWGRHWLDAAGYADSEGYTDDDLERPHAYKYRDYVIRSFNVDKRLDQFIVEQLAGDELVESPLSNLAPADADRLIATGFLRMAPDGTGGSVDDPPLARNETVAKTIEIVSSSLLGLTVACAQCHHHRYDPISQEDYYRFRAIFEPAFDWQNWRTPAQRLVSLYTDEDRRVAAEIETKAAEIDQQRTAKQQQFIDATFEKELAKLAEDLREPIRQARATPEAERTAEQLKLLKEYPSVNVTAGSLYLYDQKAADELQAMADQAAAVRATKPKEEFVRALTERPGQQPPATFVFARGDHQQPKQQVHPGELAVLCHDSPPQIVDNDAERISSGRRLAYARWLTNGQHPLLARVFVNRVWMHYFGRGIVETTADFGTLGTEPSHPQLLDWLASELVTSGWSIKHVHRLIVTSTTYRQNSAANPRALEVDADNRWLWRMPLKRLDAESLRDCLLVVAGDLNSKPFGPAVPVMADSVGRIVIGIENLNAGRPGAVIAMHGEDHRRSVYVQFRRSRPLSIMEAFDAPRMDPNCTSRASSTVATQSLMLMNNDFVLQTAQRLADRLLQTAPGDTTAQIEAAWQRVYNQQPTEDERQRAAEFLQQQATDLAARVQRADEKKTPAQIESESRHWALTTLCQALLSSNRFLYIE